MPWVGVGPGVPGGVGVGHGSGVAPGGPLPFPLPLPLPLPHCCTGEQTSVGANLPPHVAPKGWNERSRFKLPHESAQRRPKGGVWTHPVVANGRLFVRDQVLLFCYEIKP